MHALLLAGLLACTTPPAPSGRLTTTGAFPDFDMGVVGASSTLQLHSQSLRRSATYALEDSNLPAGSTVGERVEIDLTKRRGRRGQVVIALPFRLDDDAEKSLGLDLKVSVDGSLLRFRSLGGGARTWRPKGKREIVIQAPGKIAVLEYAGGARLLDRFVLSRSGLPAADFVAHDLTIDGHTRQGLLLPSPSQVRWTVDLPDGAIFEGFPTIQPSALGTGGSDGLDVVLSVTIKGAVTEVARHKLREPGFQEWRVDLSPYAGAGVELTLATEVHGTPDWDYAFVGSPTIWGTPPGEVRRVIVIGLDTTRPDKLGWYGNPTLPSQELDRIANQSAVFTQAWTPAPRTRPSFRTATTGRYPLEAVGAENIGAVFHRHGFATAGIVANIHLQPRFDFDDGFDTWKFEGRAKADQQVDDALAFFEKNVDRDTYMFLHFMDPHIPYVAPAEFSSPFVHDPDPDLPGSFNRTDVNRWARDGSLTDQRMAHIRALYDGEIAFTSRQIGRLIDRLDTLPGKTLLVVHSDHGEEFWEHGGFEHNHTVYDEVTRAVLWVRPPGGSVGGPLPLEHAATLADIAPTLYDYLGFSDLPPTDGISLRPAIEGAPVEPRDLGIAHIRYGPERWAVVHRGHKYIVATATGKEELFAVDTVPIESHDLADQTDLEPWRGALVGAHPGLKAGPGWRIELDLKRSTKPVVFTLPGPASAVGVLDPESLLRTRANLAWGEQPRKRTEDVGTVELSSDRATLTFTPGPSPAGTLWVLFPKPQEVASTVVRAGETPVTFTTTGGVSRHIGATGARIELKPGFVVVSPPGEAARMKALSGSEPDTADAQETCRLCLLGYKDGEECLKCEGYNP